MVKYEYSEFGYGYNYWLKDLKAINLSLGYYYKALEVAFYIPKNWGTKA